LSTYSIPNINNNKPQLADSGFWADIRFDADDSQPTYIGLHVTKGAATSDLNWKLYKFFYSGTAITEIQLAYNSWDNRASAF
jgi:hypothetical protein